MSKRPTGSSPAPPPDPLFSRGSWPEAARISEVLRQETVGGALLLLAAVIALVWANSPTGDAYAALRDYKVGPEALHLHLSLGTWAADGLLAIFFFVAGLELKREFVAGDLKDPRRAALPVAAAVGGMIAPAIIYVLINLDTGNGALAGWAVPVATDIAFAIAILAVISSHLPSGLRTFLLTLAVVDDLLAIAIIAVFFTSDLEVIWLGLALVPLAAFTVAVQNQVKARWLLLPLAFAAWALVHASGVHATVAGVLLGFAVPVLRSEKQGGPQAGPGLAEHFEHLFRPLSAGIAVPVFAFFSAGVAVGGLSGYTDALSDRITLGVIAGLVLGKLIGISGATFLVSKFTKAELDDELSWIDVMGMSLLGGIGFTVSLLIGELAFGAGTIEDEHVKVGVLTGSLLAALLATLVLRIRNRTYKKLYEAENVDVDDDGIPDVYEHPRDITR
jgi:NhaA family Na+:H+ antiporter